MFIMSPNISFDVLAELLSTDIKISDTGKVEGKDFATLLAVLIGKNKDDVSVLESIGTDLINCTALSSSISPSININPLENYSVPIVAVEEKVLDAELILQLDNSKNISTDFFLFI